jgi:hypothetical protein
MKSLLALWGILSLLSVGASALGDTASKQGVYLAGFMGIQWGQSITEIPGPQLEFVLKEGPIEYYRRKNDKLATIGSLAIESVLYGFWRERFFEARITVMSSTRDALRELELLFGEECSAERRDVRWFYYENLYTWEKLGTRITLTSPVTRVGKVLEECTVTFVSERIIEEMKIHETTDYLAIE